MPLHQCKLATAATTTAHQLSHSFCVRSWRYAASSLSRVNDDGNPSTDFVRGKAGSVYILKNTSTSTVTKASQQKLPCSALCYCDFQHMQYGMCPGGYTACQGQHRKAGLAVMTIAIAVVMVTVAVTVAAAAAAAVTVVADLMPLLPLVEEARSQQLEHVVAHFIIADEHSLGPGFHSCIHPVPATRHSSYRITPATNAASTARLGGFQGNAFRSSSKASRQLELLRAASRLWEPCLNCQRQTKHSL